MARRIVDISTALKAGIASDPKGTEPQITYIDHRQSVAQITSFFPGRRRGLGGRAAERLDP
jgi:hypothetical protein